MGWPLTSHQMFNTCAQRLQKPHNFNLFRGVGRWAGCVYSSKAIALDRDRFWKLLGETELQFVQNLKGLVDFEVRARIRKKRLAEAAASAAIQASIKRSLVPPTALLVPIIYKSQIADPQIATLAKDPQSQQISTVRNFAVLRFADLLCGPPSFMYRSPGDKQHK